MNKIQNQHKTFIILDLLSSDYYSRIAENLSIIMLNSRTQVLVDFNLIYCEDIYDCGSNKWRLSFNWVWKMIKKFISRREIIWCVYVNSYLFTGLQGNICFWNWRFEVLRVDGKLCRLIYLCRLFTMFNSYYILIHWQVEANKFISIFTFDNNNKNNKLTTNSSSNNENVQEKTSLPSFSVRNCFENCCF